MKERSALSIIITCCSIFRSYECPKTKHTINKRAARVRCGNTRQPLDDNVAARIDPARTTPNEDDGGLRIASANGNNPFGQHPTRKQTHNNIRQHEQQDDTK